MAEARRIISIGRLLIRSHKSLLALSPDPAIGHGGRFILCQPSRSFAQSSYFVRNATSVPSQHQTTSKPTSESDRERDRATSIAGTERTRSPRTEETLDAPIQFTTSEASKWKATETLLLQPRGAKDIPWFQPYVVVISVACLLIWFGILREENDIDEELGKSLWERIPGLEKSQLVMLIQHNKDRGLPTKDLEARLAEVTEKERKLVGK